MSAPGPEWYRAWARRPTTRRDVLVDRAIGVAAIALMGWQLWALAAQLDRVVGL